MKYSIIATSELTKKVRVVKTYAKLSTAESNLKKMMAKISWFSEVYSIITA